MLHPSPTSSPGTTGRRKQAEIIRPFRRKDRTVRFPTDVAAGNSALANFLKKSGMALVGVRTACCSSGLSLSARPLTSWASPAHFRTGNNRPLGASPANNREGAMAKFSPNRNWAAQSVAVKLIAKNDHDFNFSRFVKHWPGSGPRNPRFSAPLIN